MLSAKLTLPSYRRPTSNQRLRLKASSLMSPLTKAEIDSPSAPAICWTTRLWNSETLTSTCSSRVPTVPFKIRSEPFRQKPRLLASSRISCRKVTDIGSPSALAIRRSIRSCLNGKTKVLLGIVNRLLLYIRLRYHFSIIHQVGVFVKSMYITCVNLAL